MSTLRKTELIGGVVTVILGMLFVVLAIREDEAAAIRLQLDFSLYQFTHFSSSQRARSCWFVLSRSQKKSGWPILPPSIMSIGFGNFLLTLRSHWSVL